jgi:hypothetical protein
MRRNALCLKSPGRKTRRGHAAANGWQASYAHGRAAHSCRRNPSLGEPAVLSAIVMDVSALRTIARSQRMLERP